MNIVKISAVAIIAVFLSTLLKRTNPVASICIILTTGVVIIFSVIKELTDIFNNIENLFIIGGIDTESYKNIIKITGVAYFTEITSGLCRDADENSLAVKIEIVGRISIVYFTLPIISNLIDIIKNAILLI